MEERLDEIFSNSPEEAVSRIRWRQSRGGGRTWVQPASTKKQIDAVNKCGSEERSGNREDTKLTIKESFSELPGVGTEEAILKVMEILRS